MSDEMDVVIGRWERWGPISGLLLCITWAPMAFAIPRLPDLGSAQRVEAFWRDNQELMQGVILSVSVGFLFLLGFLGALVERLRAALAAPAIIWVAFGSALMFMTALNVALGLDIAGGLLVDLDPASTYALHTAAFLLAAPAALAGTAFFVAIAAITWQTGIFPRVVGMAGHRRCPRECGGRSRDCVADRSTQFRQRRCGRYRCATGVLPGVDLRGQCVVATQRKERHIEAGLAREGHPRAGLESGDAQPSRRSRRRR